MSLRLYGSLVLCLCALLLVSADKVYGDSTQDAVNRLLTGGSVQEKIVNAPATIPEGMPVRAPNSFVAGGEGWTSCAEFNGGPAQKGFISPDGNVRWLVKSSVAGFGPSEWREVIAVSTDASGKINGAFYGAAPVVPSPTGTSYTYTSSMPPTPSSPTTPSAGASSSAPATAPTSYPPPSTAVQIPLQLGNPTTPVMARENMPFSLPSLPVAVPAVIGQPTVMDPSHGSYTALHPEAVAIREAVDELGKIIRQYGNMEMELMLGIRNPSPQNLALMQKALEAQGQVIRNTAAMSSILYGPSQYQALPEGTSGSAAVQHIKKQYDSLRNDISRISQLEGQTRNVLQSLPAIYQQMAQSSKEKLDQQGVAGSDGDMQHAVNRLLLQAVESKIPGGLGADMVSIIRGGDLQGALREKLVSQLSGRIAGKNGGEVLQALMRGENLGPAATQAIDQALSSVIPGVSGSNLRTALGNPGALRDVFTQSIMQVGGSREVIPGITLGNMIQGARDGTLMSLVVPSLAKMGNFPPQVQRLLATGDLRGIIDGALQEKLGNLQMSLQNLDIFKNGMSGIMQSMRPLQGMLGPQLGQFLNGQLPISQLTGAWNNVMQNFSNFTGNITSVTGGIPGAQTVIGGGAIPGVGGHLNIPGSGGAPGVSLPVAGGMPVNVPFTAAPAALALAGISGGMLSTFGTQYNEKASLIEARIRRIRTILGDLDAPVSTQPAIGYSVVSSQLDVMYSTEMLRPSGGQ